MTDEQDQRGIGDNMPPADEDPLAKVNPEKLVDCDVTAVLYAHYAALVERRIALKKDIEGWIEDHTPAVKRGAKAADAKPVVGDEQDLKDTTDSLNQIRDFIKDEVEPTRKKVAASVDKAKKDIQKFFAEDMADVLKKTAQPVRDAQSLALIEKENRERLRLREEAWEKAQLANRLAIQARRARGETTRESLLEVAFKVEDEAARLEQAAEASAVELTRTRTDLQQVTGLRDTWKFEVESLPDLLAEIVAGRQAVAMVTVNEAHVNGLIRGKDGVRKIPGLRIFVERTGR